MFQTVAWLPAAIFDSTFQAPPVAFLPATLYFSMLHEVLNDDDASVQLSWRLNPSASAAPRAFIIANCSDRASAAELLLLVEPLRVAMATAPSTPTMAMTASSSGRVKPRPRRRRCRCRCRLRIVRMLAEL